MLDSTGKYIFVFKPVTDTFSIQEHIFSYIFISLNKNSITKENPTVTC